MKIILFAVGLPLATDVSPTIMIAGKKIEFEIVERLRIEAVHGHTQDGKHSSAAFRQTRRSFVKEESERSASALTSSPCSTIRIATISQYLAIPNEYSVLSEDKLREDEREDVMRQ